MLSRRGAISAMVGAAMLAMPVSAFASHQDHDFRGRPQAWHDQGEHRGGGSSTTGTMITSVASARRHGYATSRRA